jgi:UDP-N-acetylglucosamine 4-epimerase
MTAYESLKQELKSEQKTWLITGVAGFIGSNLLEALLRFNQYVVGLDNFSTGYEHNLDEVQNTITPEQWINFNFIQGDIKNLEDCRRACDGVDYVLHNAALGFAARSIEDPITTNQNNIDGFLNMLVAARDAKVQRFVYVASNSTFGDHPSPFAVTSLVNELYAHVFARSYGFKSIGLRYFNIFGRRQYPDSDHAAVIPTWIAAMIKNEPVYINGDGESSFGFCYIENAIWANLLAAASTNEYAVNQVYNVAVGDRTSLNQLYDYLRDHLANRFPHLKDAKPVYRTSHFGDVVHSLADIGKARDFIGYNPTHKVNDGLKEAMDWYLLPQVAD